MNLKEMKIKVFSLIEEYYPELSGLAEDEDVLNKINGVINSIQMDLMKYRKIPANQTITIGAGDEKIVDLSTEILDIYQINKIILNSSNDSANVFEYIDDYNIILPSDFVGDINVYYYKIPKSAILEYNEDTLADIIEKHNQESSETTEENNEENNEETEEPTINLDELKSEYDESFVFDIDLPLLEVMPYGVARDLLRLDMISSYGTYFEKTYNELKAQIDPRRTKGMIYAVGGEDI